MELGGMSGESIERTLGTLEAKIDSLLASTEEFRSRMKEHETKIQNIELKQSYVAGMAAVVGMTASFVMSWVKEHLR